MIGAMMGIDRNSNRRTSAKKFSGTQNKNNFANKGKVGFNNNKNKGGFDKQKKSFVNKEFGNQKNLAVSNQGLGDNQWKSSKPQNTKFTSTNKQLSPHKSSDHKFDRKDKFANNQWSDKNKKTSDKRDGKRDFEYDKKIPINSYKKRVDNKFSSNSHNNSFNQEKYNPKNKKDFHKDSPYGQSREKKSYNQPYNQGSKTPTTPNPSGNQLRTRSGNIFGINHNDRQKDNNSFANFKTKGSFTKQRDFTNKKKDYPRDNTHFKDTYRPTNQSTNPKTFKKNPTPKSDSQSHPLDDLQTVLLPKPISTPQIRRAEKLKNTKSESITGVLEGNAKGYAFVRVDTQDSIQPQDDVFIPARSLNGAIHGDRVLVRLSIYNGRPEGEVIRIIEHSNHLICRLSLQRGMYVATPMDTRISKTIQIDRASTQNAIDGDTVVVELSTTKGDTLQGSITEVLGSEGDIGLDVLTIIRGFGLREEFEKNTIDEAISLPKVVTKEQTKNRIDFREELVITIDGDDTKDIDDAVSVVSHKDGWTLSVHIADVAEYVKAGSSLDNEAFKRGTSVYFADRVLPMLPRQLSNGICSLNPTLDRLTLSLIMEINKEGIVTNSKICEGIINSIQLTYNKVTTILASGVLDPSSAITTIKNFGLDGVNDNNAQNLYTMLVEMDKLRTVLVKKRWSGGSIDFDLPEAKITIDARGTAIDVTRQERDNSHKMIEEFMLIANKTIAQKFDSQKIPFVYRTHAKPDSKKIETLTDFLSSLGYALKGDKENITPMDIRRLLEDIDPRHQKAVNTITLRSMQKASYEPHNNGHFGLAFDDYTHFTSPIRRYPDLAIHRIIKDYLHKDKTLIKKYKDFVVSASKQASKTERIAEEAERKVDELKKAEYIRGHIGESYTGIISGIIEKGIFVELPNTIEGMIKTENLKGFFTYEPKSMSLVSGSHTYHIGDTLKIKVHDINDTKIEFVLANSTLMIDNLKPSKKRQKSISNQKSTNHKGSRQYTKTKFKKTNSRKR